MYLVEHDFDAALTRLRSALLHFLHCHGIDPSKYHETMTAAWLLAVMHFMAITPASESADAFIDANPALLDSRIMLTHYSADQLFSAAKRRQFIEPDLDPISRHEQ